jgi:putative ubiquitin-RnfH superfamily antitoxin RatB of RatAB toxin-antitoxin module
MSEAGSVRVEVAYATPPQQTVIALRVPATATVEEVIQQSGILAHFPGIDLRHASVGIFGEVARLGDRVHDNDRIEIYRSLIADPKEARRRRTRRL